MLRHSLRIITGCIGVMPFAASAAGAPAPGISLAGDVFVERFAPAADGRLARILERADALHSGDRLVFVVSWNGRATGGFTVTNPVPRSIAYTTGADNHADEVSVDGGRTWGTLDTRRVRDGGGWRPALPADVTHVRWRVPGGMGQITYRGVVR